MSKTTTNLKLTVEEMMEDEKNKADPVRILQGLFGKPNRDEPRKVRKVGTNLIMQKYKSMERKRNRDARLATRGQTDAFMSQ